MRCHWGIPLSFLFLFPLSWAVHFSSLLPDLLSHVFPTETFIIDILSISTPVLPLSCFLYPPPPFVSLSLSPPLSFSLSRSLPTSISFYFGSSFVSSVSRDLPVVSLCASAPLHLSGIQAKQLLMRPPLFPSSVYHNPPVWNEEQLWESDRGPGSMEMSPSKNEKKKKPNNRGVTWNLVIQGLLWSAVYAKSVIADIVCIKMRLSKKCRKSMCNANVQRAGSCVSWILSLFPIFKMYFEPTLTIYVF